MNIALYVESAAEKSCCTCAKWTGTRIAEADDYVYSLDALKGGCDDVKGSGGRTLPGDSCRAWKKWCELEIEPVAMMASRPAISRYRARSN